MSKDEPTVETVDIHNGCLHCMIVAIADKMLEHDVAGVETIIGSMMQAAAEFAECVEEKDRAQIKVFALRVFMDSCLAARKELDANPDSPQHHKPGHA